jgi:dipeptidyl aminopeptidase/acylaminoacyl peptidase
MASLRKKILTWTTVILVITGLIAYSQIVIKMTYALTHPPLKTSAETPAKYGITFQDVTFPSQDNKETLSGWYLTAPKNKLTVIIVNGIGDTRANLARVDLASRLVHNGFNILMFDWRHQGQSTGAITSGGYFEQQDLLGAINYLYQKQTTPPCVGVLGASMGAATTLLTAPNQPHIQAIVADSSYADIGHLLTSEIKRTSPLPTWSIPVFLPGLYVAAQLQYGINLSSLKPINAVAQIPYPIFFIHGLADQRIPVTESEALYKAAAPGSELWEVPQAEHANAFAHVPDAYTQKTTAYFANRLTQSSCQ